MLRYEVRAQHAGFKLIAGIDEAGRGPLAGPVVAGAVILKELSFVERIDDSKVLSPAGRQKAYEEILKKAYVGVGIVDERQIDEINIAQATLKAMELAAHNLMKQLAKKTSARRRPKRNKVKSLSPTEISKKVFFLIDGNIAPSIPSLCRKIIKGDKKSLSIAAASIVAKVRRDRLMKSYHKLYPQYRFDRHKGYCTKDHVVALHKYGPSPIHRRSFRPIRACLPGLTNAD